LPYQEQKENIPYVDRKATWKDDEVPGGREVLRSSILTLSGQWKKEQAGKEEAKS
jgi:hypothetical protein